MHTIQISPYQMKLAHGHALRAAVVFPDPTQAPTQAPIEAISDGTHTHRVLGASIQRMPISALPESFLKDSRLRSTQYVVEYLCQQGHPVTGDSMVSLVAWERFATTEGAPSEYRTSDRPMQSSAVYDDCPANALERFLQPIATAKVGQPIAVSLPYDVQALSGVRDDLHTGMIRVLGMGKNGPALSMLHAIPPTFAQRVAKWARYGVGANDWKLAVGKDAVQYLRAYARPLTFDAEVFFFRDRAIAIADAPERLVMTAIAADNPATSAHHDLAAVGRIKDVLDVLRRAPMLRHPD